MGLFNLFDKEKRNASNSISQYNRCADIRIDIIKSFRINALAEIKLKYPNSEILMNYKSTIFFVICKDRNQIFIGWFADLCAPCLDFISNDKNTEDRLIAVKKFNESLKNRRGVIALESYGKAGCDGYHYPDSRKSFFEKGYEFLTDFEAGRLFGASLFLNGSQIGKSSFLNPRKIGYFSDVIYENIIDKKIRTNTGFSKLTLILNRLNYIGGSHIFGYEVIFGNENQTNTRYALSSNSGIIGLRDFLSSIEMPITRDYDDIGKKGFLAWMEEDEHKIDSDVIPIGIVDEIGNRVI